MPSKYAWQIFIIYFIHITIIPRRSGRMGRMNIGEISETMAQLRPAGIVRKLAEVVFESHLKAVIPELMKEYPEGWLEDAMRWQGKTN
jgi:hypothetical protein